MTERTLRNSGSKIRKAYQYKCLNRKSSCRAAKGPDLVGARPLMIKEDLIRTEAVGVEESLRGGADILEQVIVSGAGRPLSRCPVR